MNVSQGGGYGPTAPTPSLKPSPNPHKKDEEVMGGVISMSGSD